jgi:hypothetical protein
MNSIYDSMISSSSTTDTITITSGTNTTGTYDTSNGIYWGSGSSGQLLTSSGINGTSWVTQDASLKGSTLKVNGDAEFDGEITIKGKSLTDMFEKIEERLAILHPNIELEDKWDELKELGKKYRDLEREIIEKEKVWAILQK